MELCMIKNLLITYLFLITNVFAGLPPTTIKNQNAASKTVNFNLELPNNQSVPTAASTALITTGNKDELQNSNFEHSIVTTGWTVSNATASGNTANPLEGKKSLSLALTGALSLSQSSTINAAQKSGVQMVASIWVNSSDVSDLQLCSLKNGSEDKCTATGGYVQGSGWRQLTVSFLGDATSNGLKLKSTDTTGTVLVDQAYVGIGSPIVDFTPDMVFSAKVSAGGVVSGENVDWLGSCTNSTGSFSCTVNASVFNNVPNCSCTVTNSADRMCSFTTQTTTTIAGSTSNSSGAYTSQDISIICQKQGADYKTSKAYVASSSDVAYQPCTFSTLAWQGFGTVTNNLLCARKGQDLLIKGKWRAGTTAASLGQIPLPTNFGSLRIASNISSNQVLGSAWRNIGASAIYYNLLASPNTSYISVSNSVINGTNSPVTPVNGSSIVNSFEGQDIPEVKIPIQGWQDSGVIVGSFEGIEKCANDYECTDTFSAVITTGTGVVANYNTPTPWVTCTAANPSACSFSSGLKDGVNNLSSPMNCNATVIGTTTAVSSVSSATSSGFSVNSTLTTTGATTNASVHVTCQKGTNDYKPKTAKVATSIGVPTVPGVTTQAIETFSVSYGTTNATTNCTVSPCSFLDQIGNAVSSITRSTGGQYVMNLNKTYSKLKCSITVQGSSVSSMSISNLACYNCNSINFNTTNIATSPSFSDTFGTLLCQGIPQ